jgi:glycolate oxidase
LSVSRSSPVTVSLIDELTDIVGAENLLFRPDDVIVYESDATAERGLPAVVVLPASGEEAEDVVRVARRYQLPIIPRGAGTGLSGGAVSDASGVLIGTARMKRLIELDVENRFAVVEPGMVNADLSLAAAPKGLYYAPDPSSQRACTIGGNVSENSGGPHCLLYGMTTNHVLGLEVVTVDGDRCWIGGAGPDRAGYDLVGAVVGSEGTLALVTKVMVRLLKIPPATRTLLGIFESMDDASASVSAVIAAGMVPAALEMMDQVVIRAVEPAVHAGYPLDAGAVLLVELDGTAAMLEEQMSVVEAICMRNRARQVRVASSSEERARLWAGRKGALGALGRLAPNYFIQDGVVPRTKLQDVLRKIEEVSRRYDLLIANVFHAGDGNLHPNILFDAREPGMLERVREAGAEILRACTGAGGSITGEHGVGLDKQDYMEWMFSPVELDVMKFFKSGLDPDGVLNPGKMFPGAKGCGEIQGVNQRLALAAML